MERIEMKPNQCDRIIIRNVPDNYPYKNHFQGLGVVDVGFNGRAISDNGNVCFFTGYVPYKDHDFSCSGFGHSVKFSNMKFVETKPAPYWKFIDGIKKAHNAETYYVPSNYYEVDFNDINH